MADLFIRVESFVYSVALTGILTRCPEPDADPCQSLDDLEASENLDGVSDHLMGVLAIASHTTANIFI
ncbi:MAG: hypothetical protein H7A06_10855 [Pseudomonadales bacterium]|nr:hypothetical protein [Pseudomonadales bacterium]